MLFAKIEDWDLFTLLGIGRDLVLMGLLRSTDLFVMDAQCERRLLVDCRRRDKILLENPAREFEVE